MLNNTGAILRVFLLSLFSITALCTCDRAPKQSMSGEVMSGVTVLEKGSSESIVFERLRCNYAENPTVIAGNKPQFSWMVSTKGFDRRQTAFRLLVASTSELLASDQGDLWDTGKLTSASSTHVKYQGKPLAAEESYYWKVKIWDEADVNSQWSPVQSFTTGLGDQPDWESAKWITVPTDTRTSEHQFRLSKTGKMKEPIAVTSFPAGYFRNGFTVDKAVVSATAYVVGLGYYELYLNGEKIGDQVLDPAPSNYDKTSYYVVLDASKPLLKGENTIGIKLGNGFYGQNLAFKRDHESEKDLAYGPPAVRMALKLQFEDGSTQAIVTNQDWASLPGPIVFDNIYGGEAYDARFAIDDWHKNEFDASSYPRVKVTTPVVGELSPQVIDPIRKLKALKPVNIFKGKSGKWIVDFGQNIAGWVRLSVEESKGTKVQLQLTEALKRSGDDIFLGSTGGGASGLSQQLTYVSAGTGRETWEPSFTYHGFRYAEVTGVSSKPKTEDFTAFLVSTDVKETGSFQCSDSLINRMEEVSKWTVVDNLHGIPEDCPQREKCGWLGDAHATAEYILYNYDVADFYEKYMEDIRTQFRTVKGGKNSEDFQVPTMIAPGRRTSSIAKLDWGIATIYLPWYHYLHYGNEQIVADNYEDMKQLTAYYLSFKTDEGIIENGMGDWCPPRWDRRKNPEAMECHPVVSATAYFYDILKVMREFALVVEDEDYISFLDKEITELQTAFNTVYLEDIPGTDKSWYGSQTATVMALQFDLVPAVDKESVVEGLVHDINMVNNGHHTVGIHGNRYLYSVLSDNGYADLAYSVLTVPTFPSQAFVLHTGFTTWPERQFDWSEGIEFSNSLNHPMHSGFAAYFYERLGGIKPMANSPGYKTFIIDPIIPQTMNWANTEILSPYGPIKNSWERNGEILTMQLSVPFNTTAHLPLTQAKTNTLTVNGEEKKLDNSVGPLRLGSGEYTVSFEL